MTYNTLDNLTMAEKFRELITLEIADLGASLEYQEATSTVYNPDDPDDPQTNYSIGPDSSNYEHLGSMYRLIDAINEYLKDKRP